MKRLGRRKDWEGDVIEIGGRIKDGVLEGKWRKDFYEERVIY